MGRRKAFDEDEVLEKAMHLFWEQGYQATSMAELEQTLGINKFSIYNSFGNKHSLFLRSLDRYHKQRFSLMLLCLTQNVTGLCNIQQFFDTLLQVLSSQPNKIGCLLTNSSLEFGTSDPAVQQRILLSYGLFEDGFYQCLQRAQQNKEIPSQLHLQDAARCLVATTQGLLAIGKNTQDDRILRSTVSYLITSLRGENSPPQH